MLEICKKLTPIKHSAANIAQIEEEEKQDIIVTRYKKVTTYNEDGSWTTKREPQKINLTKKINETKKLIKTEQAAALEKLAELEKIMSK